MNLEKYMVPCLNKTLFGVECPGCGTQRAFFLIIKGEFSAAFHQFPAIYTSVLLFGILSLHFIDKRRNYHKIIIGTAILNAIVMIVSYIYKISILI